VSSLAIVVAAAGVDGIEDISVLSASSLAIVAAATGVEGIDDDALLSASCLAMVLAAAAARDAFSISAILKEPLEERSAMLFWCDVSRGDKLFLGVQGISACVDCASGEGLAGIGLISSLDSILGIGFSEL
jgi:hypothetical protein